jgi:hypothetical protein
VRCHYQKRQRFSLEVRLACQTKIVGDIKLRRLVVDDEDIRFTQQIAEGHRPALIGEAKPGGFDGTETC